MILKITIVALLIFGCQKPKAIKTENEILPEVREPSVTINQITTNYDTLVNRVNRKGDEDAYDELFYGFIDWNETSRTDSVMKYSKIMALKFDFEKGYSDYFYAFCEKYNVELDWGKLSSLDISKLKPFQKNEAINWLKKMRYKKVITETEFRQIKK